MRAVPPDVAEAVLAELADSGVAAAPWALAWARTLPTALIVPAFGLGFLPISLRVAFAAVLSLAIAPAVPGPAVPAGLHWLAALTGELARGVPVALSAAITVWAGSLAGGVADAGLWPGGARPDSAGRLSLARWLGVPAAALFLELGGASRVATRLAAPPLDGAYARAAYDLAAGIDVGVTLGIPVLLVALFADLVMALAGRESRPFGDPTITAPVRTLVVMVLLAAFLERTMEALARLAAPAM